MDCRYRIHLSEIAAQVAELDTLIREVIKQEIPPGFADRVVAKIWEEESKGDKPFSQRLPLTERILYSKAVQWVVAAIGSFFGLFKIFRFFSGSFI